MLGAHLSVSDQKKICTLCFSSGKYECNDTQFFHNGTKHRVSGSLSLFQIILIKEDGILKGRGGKWLCISNQIKIKVLSVYGILKYRHINS